MTVAELANVKRLLLKYLRVMTPPMTINFWTIWKKSIKKRFPNCELVKEGLEFNI